MHAKQILRQTLAENGQERTPDEINELLDLLCPPFEIYEKFLTMSDEDISIMANACGDTYEKAKEVVDISIYIGHLKWGVE